MILSANPDKIDKSEKLASTNLSERTPFLGLVSYYRSFISNLAAIGKCLNQLVAQTNTEKDNKTKAVCQVDNSCGQMSIMLYKVLSVYLNIW